MKVHVVMSNDYPDCVFEDGPAAEAYCKKKNDEDKKKQSGGRIYYRAYEFELTRNQAEVQ